MLHVGTCDTGSQKSGMLVASRILGNSLVNDFVLFSDLCCLACLSCWYDGKWKNAALHSTGIVMPVSSKPCILDSRR